MGDILVPYFNKQLPFHGFGDYSITGGGPPTAAKLPLYLCLRAVSLKSTVVQPLLLAAAREAGDLLAIKRTGRVRTKQR